MNETGSKKFEEDLSDHDSRYLLTRSLSENFSFTNSTIIHDGDSENEYSESELSIETRATKKCILASNLVVSESKLGDLEKLNSSDISCVMPELVNLYTSSNERLVRKLNDAKLVRKSSFEMIYLPKTTSENFYYTLDEEAPNKLVVEQEAKFCNLQVNKGRVLSEKENRLPSPKTLLKYLGRPKHNSDDSLTSLEASQKIESPNYQKEITTKSDPPKLPPRKSPEDGALSKASRIYDNWVNQQKRNWKQKVLDNDMEQTKEWNKKFNYIKKWSSQATNSTLNNMQIRPDSQSRENKNALNAQSQRLCHQEALHTAPSYRPKIHPRRQKLLNNNNSTIPTNNFYTPQINRKSQMSVEKKPNFVLPARHEIKQDPFSHQNKSHWTVISRGNNPNYDRIPTIPYDSYNQTRQTLASSKLSHQRDESDVWLSDSQLRQKSNPPLFERASIKTSILIPCLRISSNEAMKKYNAPPLPDRNSRKNLSVRSINSANISVKFHPRSFISRSISPTSRNLTFKNNDNLCERFS